MNCPYCEGRVIKAGISPLGKQIYRCKECYRTFMLEEGEKEPKKAFSGMCPYCGGIMTSMGKTPTGKKRYKCLECKRSITTDSDVKLAKRFKLPCPHCGSKDVSKQGNLRDGSPRYLCKSCGKGFSEKTVIKPKIDLTCPECGGDNIATSTITNAGSQLYKCRDCGKRFVADKKTNKRRFYILCPDCGTIGALKQNGEYYCTKCKKKIEMDKGEYTFENVVKLYKQGFPMRDIADAYGETYGKIRWMLRTTSRDFEVKKVVQREEAVKAVLDGMSLEEASKKYGYCRTHLRELVSAEYPKECLTIEQKNIIIKYGLYCNVPIKDLAPYVKCSQKRCKEELERLNGCLSILRKQKCK